jgi:hypothetical protein
VATTESACTIGEDSEGAIADIMMANTHKIIATVDAFIDFIIKRKLTIIYLTQR